MKKLPLTPWERVQPLFSITRKLISPAQRLRRMLREDEYLLDSPKDRFGRSLRGKKEKKSGSKKAETK